jgi:hypothetical protein
MAMNESKKIDKWQKLESIAKIVAGFSAAVSAILIPILINSYTEENRKAEMYVKMMTEREKSDTDIRQSIFQGLLAGFLDSMKEEFSKIDNEAFRRRIMFLELIALNFQEYFNAKPLFEEVYAGLERKKAELKVSEEDKKKWENLEMEFIRFSRNIVSNQATMLNTIGTNVVFNIEKEKPICVRLYNREDFADLRQKDGVTPIESYISGHCSDPIDYGKLEGTKNKKLKNDHSGLKVKIKDRPENDSRKSLSIMPVRVEKTRVTVYVGIYDDMFEEKIYHESVLNKSLSIDLSIFDFPYMDNVKLGDGSRFSLVLREVWGDSAVIEAIRFKNDFISLRDRPLYEELLQKLEIGDKTK